MKLIETTIIFLTEIVDEERTTKNNTSSFQFEWIPAIFYAKSPKYKNVTFSAESYF